MPNPPAERTRIRKSRFSKPAVICGCSAINVNRVKIPEKRGVMTESRRLYMDGASALLAEAHRKKYSSAANRTGVSMLRVDRPQRSTTAQTAKKACMHVIQMAEFDFPEIVFNMVTSFLHL